MAVLMYIPTTVVSVFFFSTSVAAFFIFCLFGNSHSYWGEVKVGAFLILTNFHPGRLQQYTLLPAG
jgi:hypothetical protein